MLDHLAKEGHLQFHSNTAKLDMWLTYRKQILNKCGISV
jgi:hypothetical protein